MKKLISSNIGKTFLLASIVFCLGSCESSPFDFQPSEIEWVEGYTPEADNPVFKQKWETRVEEREHFSGEGSLYNNWYIQGTSRPPTVEEAVNDSNASNPLTINAYNQDSGELEWSVQSSGEVQGGSEVCIIVDGVYLAMSYGGIVAIDLESSTVMWEWSFRSATWIDRGHQLVPYDGMVYVALDYGVENDEYKMFRIDPFSGSRTEVYSVKDSSLSPPVFHYDPSRQAATMLVNVFPNHYGQEENGVQHVHAVDVNSGTLLWQIENCTENFPGSIYHPPVIYKDILITGGDWSLYGFDLNTQEQLWRTQYEYMPTIWTRSNHLIVDDLLYVIPGGGDVSCVNPINGEIIWNNPNDGMWCARDILHLDNMLIYGNLVENGLMFLNAQNGGLIHFEPGYTNNNVLHNPQSDMLFTSNHQTIVGLQRD